MQGRQLASGFTPFFPEIIYMLRDNVSSMTGRWIYFVLATCFPVEEDWEGSDGTWVVGTVLAQKKEIMKRSRVTSKGGFYKAWRNLLDSGYVIDNGDGSFTLPKFKKAKHQAIFPLVLEERLSRVEALVYDQDPESGNQGSEKKRRIPGKESSENAKKSSERTQKSSERTQKSSERTRESSDILLKGLKRKNSLSSIDKVVSYMYRGIGQKRISKQKRERARVVVKGLIKDGFDLEEILFAIDWTLENAKEEPYDFSIIQHTIGQAIAATKKEQAEAKETEQRERAAIEEREKREREDREAEEIEAYRESLTPEERAALRKQAQNELSDEGVKDNQIDDFLIEVKERQILRKRIAEESDQIEQEDI